MAWGTITVGRITLRETVGANLTYNQNTGRSALVLAGQESTPPLTLTQLKAKREDLVDLVGRFLPVRFVDKTALDGYYRVVDTGATIVSWQGEVAWFDWTLSLSRIGPDNAVDAESRLTGVVRLNDFALTGERWHAPAGSAYGYFTGPSTRPAGSVVRASSDGPVTVYRGLPNPSNPRWGSALANYGIGRSRIFVSGIERAAENVSVGASAWELSNGLVSASAGASATFRISAWGGSAWAGKDWNLSLTAAASAAVTSWDSATILRNDYEAVTLRLLKSSAPGRALVDLTLRRGARHLEVLALTDISTTFGLYAGVAETAASAAGYLTAAANDAAGNRYVIGSARAFTSVLAAGNISKAASTQFDVFIGAVVGGSAAAAGDGASAVRDQYLTTLAETTMGVRR